MNLRDLVNEVSASTRIFFITVEKAALESIKVLIQWVGEGKAVFLAGLGTFEREPADLSIANYHLKFNQSGEPNSSVLRLEDLAREVSARTKENEREVSSSLSELFSMIGKAAGMGERVSVHGLGDFERISRDCVQLQSLPFVSKTGKTASTVAANPPRDKDSVIAEIESILKNHWQKRNDAYLSGTEFHEEMFGNSVPRVPRSQFDIAPDSVVAAAEFYNKACSDWGSAALLQLQSKEGACWIVSVGTDGDDGWLEVFDEQGNALAAARRYLELVCWVPTEQVRAYTKTGEFPNDMADRMTKTLWRTKR